MLPSSKLISPSSPISRLVLPEPVGPATTFRPPIRNLMSISIKRKICSLAVTLRSEAHESVACLNPIYPSSEDCEMDCNCWYLDVSSSVRNFSTRSMDALHSSTWAVMSASLSSGYRKSWKSESDVNATEGWRGCFATTVYRKKVKPVIMTGTANQSDAARVQMI